VILSKRCCGVHRFEAHMIVYVGERNSPTPKPTFLQFLATFAVYPDTVLHSPMDFHVPATLL
jgi:hypothetical protein